MSRSATVAPREPEIARYALPDLEKATGYTTDQLRDRLRLLQPILGESFYKGARGKVLVGDPILAALRRMVELERDGLSARVAVGEVAKELASGDGNGSGTVGYGQPAAVEAVLREMIEELRGQVIELRKERDHWRELALSGPARPHVWGAAYSVTATVGDDLRGTILGGKERNPWWWPLRRFVFGG